MAALGRDDRRRRDRCPFSYNLSCLGILAEQRVAAAKRRLSRWRRPAGCHLARKLR